MHDQQQQNMAVEPVIADLSNSFWLGLAVNEMHLKKGFEKLMDRNLVGGGGGRGGGSNCICARGTTIEDVTFEWTGLESFHAVR